MEEYLIETYALFDSYDKTIDFLKKKQLEAEKEGDHYGVLLYQLKILEYLNDLNDFEALIQAGYEAIRIKKQHNVSAEFGYVYYCIGEAFRQLNQPDSAWHYIEKGITHSIEKNENKELADNFKGKANLLFDEGKYGAAKVAADRAIALRRFYDRELLDIYAKINTSLGDYKTAHNALRESWDEWTESNTEEEAKKVAAILIEDKTEIERDQERRQFEHQIKSQRQNSGLILLGLFCVFGLISAYILVRANRKLRLLNNTLVQRNTALEQFAYITSHDLKEPIRSISSFAGLLERNFKRNNYGETELDYLAFIKNGAQELFEIVESLKAFTDVAFTKVELEDVPIDESFKSVQKNLDTFIEEKNGTLKFINEHNVNTVHFSKPMLILALQHLVQNGFKYNESAFPKVTIEVLKRGNKVHFKISDNGIGIEPEYFDKIFIPFKTLKNKTVNRSAGLGLSICKNILENHGGKIWVESDGRNGSNFTFAI